MQRLSHIIKKSSVFLFEILRDVVKFDSSLTLHKLFNIIKFRVNSYKIIGINTIALSEWKYIKHSNANSSLNTRIK